MNFSTGIKVCTITVTIWMCCALFCCCDGHASYSDVTKLFQDKLGSSSGYNDAVVPLLNQSQSMKVNVTFDIIAIIKIDAIRQEFIVNGYLGLSWIDELLTWNLSDYNNKTLISPYPKQIWRPRVILANTLDERDLFEDDYSPTTVQYDGLVGWFPGSLFPTSCKLNLYKYPYDTQECYIELLSMGLSGAEIKFFAPTGKVGTDYYVMSGEWLITGTKIEPVSNQDLLASFKITFSLKRLPMFFIINIVVPIVLISFLNILVFLIPVDSGEKISYGITVLLALTVYMSAVSDEVPRSSDTIPLVTVYLLVLTILSVCTVIMSIIIVFFHHREEKEDRRQKATASFKDMFHKINLMKRATTNMLKVHPSDSKTSKMSEEGELKDRPPTESTHTCENDDDLPPVNRWRLIGKHLDFVSLVVFMIIWVSVTLGFLVEIAR